MFPGEARPGRQFGLLPVVVRDRPTDLPAGRVQPDPHEVDQEPTTDGDCQLDRQQCLRADHAVDRCADRVLELARCGIRSDVDAGVDDERLLLDREPGWAAPDRPGRS